MGFWWGLFAFYTLSASAATPHKDVCGNLLRQCSVDGVISGPARSASPLTRAQVKRVMGAVRATFVFLRNNPDVLPREWAEANHASRVPSRGFCFVAANAVYHLLGGKAAGLTPMFAKYDDEEMGEGASHWWLRDLDGAYLDPTADQYTAYGKFPPYENGKGAGFNRPLHVPTKAGALIMEQAKKILRRAGYRSNGLPN